MGQAGFTELSGLIFLLPGRQGKRSIRSAEPTTVFPLPDTAPLPQLLERLIIKLLNLYKFFNTVSRYPAFVELLIKTGGFFFPPDHLTFHSSHFRREENHFAIGGKLLIRLFVFAITPRSLLRGALF